MTTENTILLDMFPWAARPVIILALLIASVAGAVAVHFLLWALFKRFFGERYPVLHDIILRTRAISRFAFIMVAFSMAVSVAPFRPRVANGTLHRGKRRTAPTSDRKRMIRLPTPDLDRTAMFLDIDGTLLDIALTPDSVCVPKELVHDLALLRERCGGALALVSGRTLEDIDRLFAPLRLPAAGAHGTQVRPDPDEPIGHLTRPIPAELRAKFTALADRPGMFIEDKEVTLALHYRLLEDPTLPAARVAEVEAAAAQTGFSLLHGKKVLELKPAGTDKGSALRAFMAKPPFSGRVPLFAGDDVTDGYAFAVLESLGGIGISVGRTFPGAAYQVAGPAELRQWLHVLLEPSVGEQKELGTAAFVDRP